MRRAERAGLTVAALLATGALAACGSDNPDTSSSAALSKCASEKTTGAAASLTSDQKKKFCECAMPKLSAAGFKKFSDADKALNDQDPKAIKAITPCLTSLIRGY